MSELFFAFSLIFGLAVCAGMIAGLFRQPAFLGHVIVGLLVGYWGLVSGGEVGKLLDTLSSAGVMLLLFLVGLEMNVSEIKKMGMSALVVGFGQILLTALIFVFLLSPTGLDLPARLFLGIILAFSSTIVTVKLLSEKHDLDSLFGKMAVTILLIQDLSAIIMLIVFGGVNGGSISGTAVLTALFLKVILLFGLAILVSRKVMPPLLHRVSRSVDELILFSLAWCFVLAAVTASPLFGLSVEIGGFLAGLTMSGSFEHTHIAIKIKPVRDFFLTIFFISLGLKTRLDLSVLSVAVLVSLIVVIGKPLLVWVLMRTLGYRQRVSFYTGLFLGQISEFSFILVGLGVRNNFFDSYFVSLIALVGLITMVISSYLIIDSAAVFKLLKPILNWIWKEGKEVEIEEDIPKEMSDHIILFGCHRMGRSILSHFTDNKDRILIVDFNPEIVTQLRTDGWRVIYADLSETDGYEQFNFPGARMVVSTVRDLNDNLSMLAELKRRRLKISVIIGAETSDDARRLYKAGATYVVLPHFVGGLHLYDLIKKGVKKKGDFEVYRKHQQEVMSGTYV